MMKMDLQFFGGRSSAGGNAKASAESRAEAKAIVERKEKLTETERANRNALNKAIERESKAARAERERQSAGTVKVTNRGMNSPVKPKATGPSTRTIRSIENNLTGSSVMTKMGSSSYRVDLSRSDASNKSLINKLKKAGFKQLGKTNSWAN